MVTDCPSCGEPAAGVVATEPGIEEIVPCGCRVAFDGGRSLHDDEGETGCLEDSGNDRCRECGQDLGAGYLCDNCDTVEGWDR